MPFHTITRVTADTLALATLLPEIVLLSDLKHVTEICLVIYFRFCRSSGN